MPAGLQQARACMKSGRSRCRLKPVGNRQGTPCLCRMQSARYHSRSLFPSFSRGSIRDPNQRAAVLHRTSREGGKNNETLELPSRAEIASREPATDSRDATERPLQGSLYTGMANSLHPADLAVVSRQDKGREPGNLSLEHKTVCIARHSQGTSCTAPLSHSRPRKTS